MKKRNSFFSIDEEHIEDIEKDVLDTVAETEKSEAGAKKAGFKKQLGVIALCAIVLVGALWAIKILSNSDEIKDSVYYPESWTEIIDPDKKPELDIYPADWDTDIITDPEYLAIKKDLIYFPSEDVGISVSKGEYVQYGGKGLELLAEYIEAVINGDNEKINGMYTEDYLKDNSKHERFPQQRVFDVKITKYVYQNPKYKDTQIKDDYFIVSYKIDFNDGLFRDDIDGESELPQLFEVLIYSDGSAKINNIINLPGYKN